MNLNELPDMSDALNQVYEGKKKEDTKPKRWQDDDGDGKWYEKSDVDGKISKREKKKIKSEEVEEVDEAMSSYDKARKAAARRAADRNAKRRRGELGGNMERESYTSEGGTRMHYKGYKAKANEEVEAVNEISPDLALKASKEADKKRGKLAAAGDKEGAAKKNAQAGRLYKAQAKKRLNREETEILDDLVESGLFSDEEIQAIIDLGEKNDA